MVARGAEAAAHADQSLADAVVQDGGAPIVVVVEQAYIHEVGRLSLHGAVFLARTCGEGHLALDERAVEHEREVLQAHEVQTLPHVQLDAVTVGALGIAVGVDQVRTTRHCVGPLDGRVKVFVESGERNLVTAFTGVPFVAHVHVVHVTGSKFCVALDRSGQVKVVVDGRADFAELRTVDRAAIAQAELVSRPDFPHGVERGEHIGARVERRLRAALVIACVADQLHAAVLKSKSGIELHGTGLVVGSGVGSGDQVVAIVIVAHLGVVDQVEAVLAVVLVDQQSGGYVQIAETCGQAVIGCVPRIDETARAVAACAILGIASGEQFGCCGAACQRQSHVGRGREDVFVQSGELAADVVARGQTYAFGVQGIVERIAHSVGQQAVGIGVAGIPVPAQPVCDILARELRVVGGAGAVVILCAADLVALCVKSLALGVALLAQLVEDILPFVASVSAGRHKGQVEQGTQACIVIVLLVGGVAQVDAAVMLLVVSTIQGVEHGCVGAVGIAVIERCEQRDQSAVAQFARAVDVSGQIEVGPRVVVAHAPIVVQPIGQQVHPAARQGLHRCRHATAEIAQAVVEAQEVRAAGLSRQEGGEVRLVIHRTAQRNVGSVDIGHFLGVNKYKSAAEVGGILRRR